VAGLKPEEVADKPLPTFLPLSEAPLLLEAGSVPSSPPIFPLKPGHMVKFLPV
jgi:hypothetical protein